MNIPSIIHIFDYLSVAALAFMSYGILRQWHRIRITRSVKDIEFQEVLIRFTITYVLLVKIILVGDIYLIIGQCLLGTALLIYFVTLLRLKHEDNKHEDNKKAQE